MNKKHLLRIVIILAIIFFVLALIIFDEDNSPKNSVVARSFSASTVSSGEEIEITLSVYVGGEDSFYLVEEYLPEGWAVISDGGGETKDSNRLAWAVFSGAKDVAYTYILKAPMAKGTHSFDGVYGFESMNGETTNILGETTILVE